MGLLDTKTPQGGLLESKVTGLLAGLPQAFGFASPQQIASNPVGAGAQNFGAMLGLLPLGGPAGSPPAPAGAAISRSPVMLPFALAPRVLPSNIVLNQDGKPDSPDGGPVEGALTPTGAGPFGPVFKNPGSWDAIVKGLSIAKNGYVPAALDHPEIGDIGVPWGVAGTGASDGYGLSKLIKYHPEVLNDLPALLRGMTIESRTANRIKLSTPDHSAAVSLDYAGNPVSPWLLTAFQQTPK